MCINVVQGAVLDHKIRGCLGAYLGHSGNIVGGIPHKGLQFNKLYRRHLVGFLNIRGIIVFYFRFSAFGFGNTDLDMVAGYLQKIPVSGNQSHLHSFLFPALCQGPQNVIRLQAGFFHSADAHGLKHLFHDRHLLPQFLRHGLSRPLILLEQLMAEGRRMHVKSHRQIFRLFLLQNLEHDIQEAIYRIGMEPLGIAQIRHTIERSVQYAVPVNQNHFFTHTNTTVVITRMTVRIAMASK